MAPGETLACVALLVTAACWLGHVIRDSLDRRYAHQQTQQAAIQKHADTQCSLRQELIAARAETVAHVETHAVAMKSLHDRLTLIEEWKRRASAPGRS